MFTDLDEHLNEAFGSVFYERAENGVYAEVMLLEPRSHRTCATCFQAFRLRNKGAGPQRKHCKKCQPRTWKKTKPTLRRLTAGEQRRLEDARKLVRQGKWTREQLAEFEKSLWAWRNKGVGDAVQRSRRV